MAYNLTQNQKDLAQWIVKAVCAGKLKENFIIRWLDTVHLPGYSGELDEQEKALFTRNNINDLRDAGLLRVNSPNKKRFDCAVRGKIYNAVDTDFGAVAKPERSQAEIPDSTEIDIFISHSRKDQDIGAPLVEILKNAFKVKPKIRYTSADETGLDPGAFVDPSLKKQVRESRAFIGLLTPTSLKSAYVLFELGARWGIKDEIILLLAKGAHRDMLFGPLQQIHAIDCNAPALHRMLERLEKDLQRDLDKPSAYQEYVEKMIEANEQAEPEDEDQTVTQLQDEITQLKREKEELEVKLGSEDSFHGDELISIRLGYRSSQGWLPGNPIKVSWNQILNKIGPKIYLKSAAEVSIENLITNLLFGLARKELPAEGNWFQIVYDDFQTIKIRLREKGIIMISGAQKWTLTNRGIK